MSETRSRIQHATFNVVVGSDAHRYIDELKAGTDITVREEGTNGALFRGRALANAELVFAGKETAQYTIEVEIVG